MKQIPSIMGETKMIKEKQTRAGEDLMEGKEAEHELDWPPVCVKRLSGTWRLVSGKIPRAPNWAGQGQAVWERERGASLKIWVWRGGA